mmetsp:Transcript_66813/g.178613  ORF Transcript_66813/g.178613 Transcript_66813/m.178613 type:complete len:269 (+) Transcript_66813:212-1018(+)
MKHIQPLFNAHQGPTFSRPGAFRPAEPRRDKSGSTPPASLRRRHALPINRQGPVTSASRDALPFLLASEDAVQHEPVLWVRAEELEQLLKHCLRSRVASENLKPADKGTLCCHPEMHGLCSAALVGIIFLDHVLRRGRQRSDNAVCLWRTSDCNNTSIILPVLHSANRHLARAFCKLREAVLRKRTTLWTPHLISNRKQHRPLRCIDLHLSPQFDIKQHIRQPPSEKRSSLDYNNACDQRGRQGKSQGKGLGPCPQLDHSKSRTCHRI